MRYTNLSNRLNDDSCALKTRSLYNDSVTDNRLFNFYFNNSCDCPVLDDIAMENNFTVREGYGYASGCTVDKDSELRIGAAVTHDKGRQQLCARTYTGGPNINKGGLVPNVESRLKNADDTSDIRNIDKVMEKQFDVFTPMIPCLKGSVQSTQHIIPEDNSKEWRWGGRDTRSDMVSSSYLQRCGFEYRDKNWVRREPDTQGKLGR